jgi:UDP-N-acetylmuramoyl-tripeptide--D-alanyl-D-alanine ligase
MQPFSLQFVLNACAGELLKGGSASTVQRVCTDSRQAQAGDLFVALEGEKFDGHSFLADVAAAGVAAVMVHRAKAPTSVAGCAVVAVSDTRMALGQLAAQYRREFKLPIIVVAGSNGKTTTKELIASVLRQKFKALSSPASFNNDIGVPLTLLSLEPDHQTAVLEAGTNHPGELAPLVRMIQPRFGVITSIGREHLEFFGDLAGVAQEEGTLAELLPRSGRLFIHGDSPQVETVIKRSPAPTVRLGLARQNAWRATNLQMSEHGVTFRLTAPGSEFNGEYQLPLLGKHQVVNALFAIAVGAELGLSKTEVQRGLTACPVPKMRLQLSTLGDVYLLNDAYNANADSMQAALETLRDFPCRGRRVAVLGDMAELGAHAEAAHAEVGRRAAELGVAQLFAVGEMAAVMAGAARAAGLGDVEEFATVEAAVEAIRNVIGAGDVVLLKASRKTRLERIEELIRNEVSKC